MAAYFVKGIIAVGFAVPTRGQNWELQFALDNITREINRLSAEVASIDRALDLNPYSGSGTLDSMRRRIMELERNNKSLPDTSLIRISALESKNDGLVDRLKELEGANELLLDRIKTLEDSSVPRVARKSPSPEH